MQIRHATQDDLDTLNRVIEAAVMSWNLPERVKRLSMDSHLYHSVDLQHLLILVAEQQGVICGVAAIDKDIQVFDDGTRGLLLHGLYVYPDFHRQGLGSALFEATEHEGRERQLDGILVRAQKDAAGFFRKMGMHKLPVENHATEYANRYWKAIQVRE